MDKNLLIFQKLVPDTAAQYCLNLWLTHKFDFKITKPRQSKFGDYRFTHQTKQHTITVNGDLNKYSFLITYLHEVAHLITQIEYGGKVLPHGIEWKKNFSILLDPVLTKSVFPLDILFELEKYAINPKASSCSDHDLMMTLEKHHHKKEGIRPPVFLKDLKQGEKFILQEKVFMKGETRRTRVMCTELNTNKKYLVSNIAQVKLLS
jgi:SprT protein